MKLFQNCFGFFIIKKMIDDSKNNKQNIDNYKFYNRVLLCNYLYDYLF